MNLTPQTKNTLVQETNTPTTTVCEGKSPHKLPHTKIVPVEDNSSNRQIPQEPFRKTSLVSNLKEYTIGNCLFGEQSHVPQKVRILPSKRSEKYLQNISSNKQNKSKPCRNESSINKKAQNRREIPRNFTRNLPSEKENKYIQEYSSNSQRSITPFSKKSSIKECIFVEKREIPPKVRILPSQKEEKYIRNLSSNGQSKLNIFRNKSFNVDQNMVKKSSFGSLSEVSQNVNIILSSGEEGKLIQEFSSNGQIVIKPFRNESSIDGLRKNTIKESLFQGPSGIPQNRSSILSSERDKNTIDDYKLNTHTPFLKNCKIYGSINEPRKVNISYDSQTEISSNERKEKPIAFDQSTYGRNPEKLLVKPNRVQSGRQKSNPNQFDSDEVLILKSILSDFFATGGKNIPFEKYSYFTDNLLMGKMLKKCRKWYSKEYPANHDFAYIIIFYIESLNYNSTEKFRQPLDENLQKMFKYLWNALTDFFNVKTELQSFYPCTFMDLMLNYSIRTDQRKYELGRFLYYCTIMAQIAFIARQHNFWDAPLYALIFLQRSIYEIESYQNINFPVIVKEYAAELVNCLKL